ncbi:hypothetical protein [Sphaerochaeta halotolerans]|uniref:hypothetical protein n=1 Tax=Sphaerochaeta halotolerans TaxID=2293840 RepID=UPI00105844EB|nr:hypothetical protein [Sphaerochaeta halotolerans]MXI87313.1 hypothetical protein [Sphaerochaeta halotolerans]
MKIEKRTTTDRPYNERYQYPRAALDSGGVASFSAPRDGVSHLAFPALAPERNLPADSFPLAPLGNKDTLTAPPGEHDDDGEP